MKILAIDTVTEMCSAALFVNGEIIERTQLAGNQHSALILSMVDALLAEADLSLSQLDLIVNDVGPGSFTGIRIGLGVAQGLAFGADLPLLGVDALTTLANAGAEQSETDLLAMIDARMQQLYWAHYSQTENGLILKGELHLSHPDRLAGLNNKPLFVLGSGWDSYAGQLSAALQVSGHADQQFPLARHGLKLSMQCPRSDWCEAGALTPLYLRNDVAKVSKKASLA